MEPAEFAHALRVGLGRPYLFLRDHGGGEQYREPILNACLHNTAYDPQVEGDRARYMWDIIHLTDDMPFYRREILSALATSSDLWDLDQLFDLARLFAEQGDDEARQAIYRRYEQIASEEAAGLAPWCGSLQIIELDGIEGLLFVVDRVGAIALADDEFVEDDFILRSARERLGAEEVDSALGAIRRDNPRIDAYLLRVESTMAPRQASGNDRMQWATASYDQVKEFLLKHGPRAGRYVLVSWGKRASDDDLARAARDFLAEDRTDFLFPYFRIFRQRTFPLPIDRLLELAVSADQEIAQNAARALGQISDPSVRTLAFSLLRERPAEIANLLVRNYQPGDYALIMDALMRHHNSEDSLHSFAIATFDVVEANLTSDAVPVLLMLYERGPCSQCREQCVDLLESLAALPEWMIDECCYDANLDLREKMRARKAEDSRG